MSALQSFCVASTRIFKRLCLGLSLCACISGSLSAQTAGTGFWHTSGSRILDSNNTPVRIAGVNWYGFETTDGVPHGLTQADYKVVLQGIKDNGYNTVRLPFSSQMVESPTVPGAVSMYGSAGPINTDLAGLNSLQIMDAIVTQAGQIGLRVILDNHRSEAGNGAQASGLWYTDAYSEAAWIQDWQTLATRYKNDSTVIGFDLRNEPHNATSGGSCWDCGDSYHDWHLAAARAGNAVLSINPKLLIFVEGVDTYKGDAYFWGGNLEGVQSSPVQLSTANQLVYSPHDYGPTEYQQAWFNSSTTDSSLRDIWNKRWGYISSSNLAPIWIGEFGTPNTDADAKNTAAGSQGQWFSSMIGFLTTNASVSWTYWALNGEDNYGLLDSGYKNIVNALKQQELASIQFPLSPGAGVTTPTLTISGNPSSVTAASAKDDLGGAGTTTQATYTAVVNNRTSAAITNASVTLALPAEAVVISEVATGSDGSCAAATAGYTCQFASIAAGGRGGIVATVIYPQDALSFGTSQSVTKSVSVTAQAGSTTLPAASVSTTVTQRPQPQKTSETISATPSPGYSFTYGTAAVVNFALTPAPPSVIPLSAFSATIDGGAPVTVSAVGSGYQVQAGVLAGGTHSVSIRMAASEGYAAAGADITLSVQKAVPAMDLPAAASMAYGSVAPLSVPLTGVAGNGLAAPTGNVSLSVDGQPAIVNAVAGGSATFVLPSTVAIGNHTGVVTYAGDANYLTVTKVSSLTITKAPLTIAVQNASRAANSANPTFTSKITGLVFADTEASLGLTYSTTATASSPAGTYPITATAAHVDNYSVTLTPGTLNVTGASGPSITWNNPLSIVYGTPLSTTQLNATSNPALAFTYKPALGTVLNAGLQTLTVTGVPTDGSTPLTASVQIMIQQAATTTELTLPSTITSPYTMTATVKSVAGGALSGSLRFFDNATLLNTQVVTTGTVTYALPSVSAGPHSFYAVYLGESNNLASQSKSMDVAGAVGDFKLTGTPASLSVVAGKSGTASITMTPTGGLTGAITLSCSGLPTGSTCVFDPATVIADGTATAQVTKVTIGLPATTRTSLLRTPDGRSMLVACGLLPGLFLLRRRRDIGIRPLLACFSLLLIGLGAVGCGANTAYTGSGAATLGSYTATITASIGSMSRTTTVSVSLVN